MPSILVRIGRSVSKHDIAPLLTIVDLGLFDHTLDGILDIICFGLFNLSWLWYVSGEVEIKRRLTLRCPTFLLTCVYKFLNDLVHNKALLIYHPQHKTLSS